MIKLKTHTNIALAYFLMVGLLGIFLRLFFVTPIGANFRYVVHTHSHIALLGWVYIALISIIYKMYFYQEGHAKTYRRIFWFTNITLLGMLFSFPFQGYALFSITFSSLFLIASYFLAWFVIRRLPPRFKDTYSFLCVKAALWYMVVSSIGPWAIGGVMATLGNTSIWYKLSIYFYLHFQYNAWFVLALLGVLFFLFEKFRLTFDRKEFHSFFTLLNLGLILTVFLSALWVDPPLIVYLLGGAGAIFQALAFYRLYKMLKPLWPGLQERLSPFVGMLLKFAGVFLLGKILMQLLNALPYFAELSFNYTDFVIGYLHWVFLGLVSLSLFAFLRYFGLLKLPKPVFWIYFTGLVLSETLIFYKGLSLWLGLPFFGNYFLVLVLVSALLPISVGILLVGNLLKK